MDTSDNWNNTQRAVAFKQGYTSQSPGEAYISILYY